ncbi:MAG: ATP-binding protein [Clostridia bacterium]|nr:ATP-binding protein [Clostridia bacterium]
MKIVAFVGPSGTGKSHRAQMVARERNIDYIIDDAILIHDNKVIAGTSAKKAATRIESVKRALFSMPGQVEEIQEVIKKENPKSILILGTSDDMVNKIVNNLGLPKIEETVYIEDVSTPEQIALAKSTRMSEGKHVIPVPTFEIKKQFSGYLLDPLQIFKWKGRGTAPYVTEKSIIRPTFSYLGNYIISDNVIRTIAEKVAMNTTGIYKVQRVKVDSYSNGIMIYIDVILEYGSELRSLMKEYKEKAKKEIDKLTAMNVLDIQIVAKGLHIPE